MFKSILFSAIILLLLTCMTYSQTDSHGQKIGLKNNVTTEKQIPQYLLDQLEIARQNENIEEENRIMDILNSKYYDVTFYNSPQPFDAVFIPGEDEGVINNPPFNSDWMTPDREVYTHSGNTSTLDGTCDRTLDIKYCMDDRKMYIASCVNITGFHGIRVYSTSNSGYTWIYEGGLQNNAFYFTGLSMTVEQRRTSYTDSVRINVFFTQALQNNNDNAILGFWSYFKPNGTAYSIAKSIATTSSGYEFRWPLAYSNGNFNSSGTDIGCIVGIYNNAGTNLYRMVQAYMTNWSWIFSITSNNIGTNCVRPSAVYKNNPSGTDSVYIAVEQRLALPVPNCTIIMFRTRYDGGVTSAWSYKAITSGIVFHHYPCLAIQDRYNPARLVVTYTSNNFLSSTVMGYPWRSISNNGGASWSNYQLGNSATTRYTGVSTDSSGNSDFCTYMYGDSDSLNIAFGDIYSSSTLSFLKNRASYGVTDAFVPVCVVYNNNTGSYRRPGFTYWKNGPLEYILRWC